MVYQSDATGVVICIVASIISNVGVNVQKHVDDLQYEIIWSHIIGADYNSRFPRTCLVQVFPQCGRTQGRREPRRLQGQDGRRARSGRRMAARGRALSRRTRPRRGTAPRGRRPQYREAGDGPEYGIL